MDTVLIVLGVIGFGAIVIAAYVFTVAARHYVTEDDQQMDASLSPTFNKPRVTRNPKDRRSGRPVTFPLNVNGVMIPDDRRKGQDRRVNVA